VGFSGGQGNRSSGCGDCLPVAGIVDWSDAGVWPGLSGMVGWFWGWRWLHSQKLAKLPPIESVYQQMLDLLKAQGYPKHPAQTPLEYATALRPHYHSEAAGAIDEISQAYVLWRYGGKETSYNLLRLCLQHLIRDPQG